MKPWYTSVIVGVLAALSLSAAVILQLAGDDATRAWEGFALFGAFFAGVHVPAPTQEVN